MCCLSIQNKASNEDIRYRWNGAQKNEKQSTIYGDEASFGEKLNFFLYSELPKSKLEKLAQLKAKYKTLESLNEKKSEDKEMQPLDVEARK